jgi:hypothetical protein
MEGYMTTFDGTSRRGMLSAVLALSLTAVGTGAALAAPVKPCLDERDSEAWYDNVHGALENELPSWRRQSLVTRPEERIVEEDDPRWIASERAVLAKSDLMQDAVIAIVYTLPTTMIGVATLIKYYNDVALTEGWDRGGPWPDEIYDDEDEKVGEDGAPMEYFVLRNVYTALASINTAALQAFRSLEKLQAAS